MEAMTKARSRNGGYLIYVEFLDGLPAYSRNICIGNVSHVEALEDCLFHIFANCQFVEVDVGDVHPTLVVAMNDSFTEECIVEGFQENIPIAMNHFMIWPRPIYVIGGYTLLRLVYTDGVFDRVDICDGNWFTHKKSVPLCRSIGLVRSGPLDPAAIAVDTK